MKDAKKTKEQLIDELAHLRKRVAELEESAQKRIRTEEKLRESEQRLRTLMETAPDGIGVTDLEGNITYVSPPMIDLYGFDSADEIVGRNIREFIAPEDRERVWPTIRETLAKGIVNALQYEFLRKDGFRFLGELSLSLFRDSTQGPRAFIGIVRDITERTRTERELRESEQKYAALVEHANDGVVILQDEVLKFSNKAMADILGYTGDELAGVKFLDLVTPEYRALVAERHRQRIAGEVVPPYELKVLRKDGAVKDVETSASLVPYEGRVASLAIVRDITERLRLEQELVRSQKLESLAVMAGGIAHDFNNFLTAIWTNISMARMYGNLEDDISEMLGDAEKASSRARSLTQQLLAFAKGGKPIKTTVAIGQLLRDTVEFALSGSDVRSDYSVPGDLWLVSVDEGQIGQVIHNLVLNADQAMPGGGRIEITAENVLVGGRDHLPLKRGKYVKVSVADHGIGISKKHLDRVFDPFFTTKQKGSGLGLTTSFTILKNHGGHIRVDSEVDVGTRIDLFLPASEETPEPRKTGRERPTQGAGRVLFIDDDEMIRRSAGQMLARFGYDVKLAADGSEGIRFYKEAGESGTPFDAVIMDLTIRGGKGGKETIEELRKIDPNAKVIVSSGYSDDPVLSHFKEHGFCDVILKPFKVEEFGRVLRRVVAGSD